MKHDYAKLEEELREAEWRYRELELAGEQSAHVPSEKTLTLLVRAAAALAHAGKLEDALREADEAGRSVVDEANAEFGYDSLRFADMRYCWHEMRAPMLAFISTDDSPAEPGREPKR